MAAVSFNGFWIVLKTLCFLAVLPAIIGCDSGSVVYTLYRSSVVESNLRVHVASFYVNEPGVYNQDNCFTAAQLFEKQPGVIVRCQLPNIVNVALIIFNVQPASKAFSSESSSMTFNLAASSTALEKYLS